MTGPEQRGDRGFVVVPADYRCPLCTCCGAPNTSFRTSAVAAAAICEGCDIELSLFLEQEERAEDGVLDALETLTGLSFSECRRRYYREAIRIFEARLSDDRIDNAVALEIMHTRRSRDEVVAHWRQILADYKATLLRLEADGR